MAQEVHQAAVSRGLQSRALDKNFSCTNDLSQPWGLMCLGPEIDQQATVGRVSTWLHDPTSAQAGSTVCSAATIGRTAGARTSVLLVSSQRWSFNGMG